MPALDVVICSHALAVFVFGVPVAVASISASVAVLRVMLAPLTIFNVASEVQRVAQFDAEVFVGGARLQPEVRNIRVGGQVKSRHLAACRVMLLFHCTAYARGNAGFAWRAAFWCDGHNGQLLERVASGMKPATG